MSMIAMTIIMRRKNMISVKELRIGNIVKDKDVLPVCIRTKGV